MSNLVKVSIVLLQFNLRINIRLQNILVFNLFFIRGERLLAKMSTKQDLA